MNAVRLARLGDLEVASIGVAGRQFDKHSHDEFVIGANLVGEERIWLDGRSFSAGVGASQQGKNEQGWTVDDHSCQLCQLCQLSMIRATISGIAGAARRQAAQISATASSQVSASGVTVTATSSVPAQGSWSVAISIGPYVIAP